MAKRRAVLASADAAPSGIEHQPCSVVEWVPRSALHANDYNPNRVAPPELALLALSILEDGWTQPIVARRDGEIVDGFHRYTVAERPEIAALTDGLVPVSFLREVDAAHQRMSTIRHNRARGSHYVVRMADLVIALSLDGLDDEEIGRRLGMEAEEVGRFRERGNMLKRGSGDGFSPAWVPSPEERKTT